MKAVISTIFSMFFYGLAIVVWMKSGGEIKIGAFIVCANVWLAASLLSTKDRPND